MQDTLIDQGFSLMLYGMGTVFVFLTILVFATGFMSKLVNKLIPEETPKQNGNTAAPIPPATGVNTPSPQVLEAIKQAIASHRQR